MLASEKGHTEAIKALLTAPDINVNHAEVSAYQLTLLVEFSVHDDLVNVLDIILVNFANTFPPPLTPPICIVLHPSFSLAFPPPTSSSLTSNSICLCNQPFTQPPFLFPYRRRAPQL